MKRFVAIALGTALFLSLIAGAAWAYKAKLWLMDDYRSGYDLGTDYRPAKHDDRHAYCWKIGYAVHDHLLDENDDGATDWSEDARAFYLGCWAAASGEDSDHWHVAGYLDD